MTLERVEKILRYYLYEDLKHTIWGRFLSGDKIINLHGIIYLCKKCYKLGLEYGIQIERERDRKGQIIFGKASSSRRV